MIKILCAIILGGIVCGLATYSVAYVLTNEHGPFHILTRIKLWLIPANIRPKFNEIPLAEIDITELGDNVNVNEHNRRVTFFQSQIYFCESLLEYNFSFNNSLRGTIYNILDCQYCAGVWVSLWFSASICLVFQPLQLSNNALCIFPLNAWLLVVWLILWALGQTMQRMIIRAMER